MEKQLPPDPLSADFEGAAEAPLQLSVMYLKDGEPELLLVPLQKKDKVGVVAARAKKLAGYPKRSKARLICQGVILPEGASVLAETEARLVNGKCAWELVEEEPKK